ncbi:hypothetical protein HYPSUDRAFT_35195 [Hypholoma sublateritium FD-334 SS-4]|uniref:PHD-type domain-containing protein n=1 Tax=Hypholoma sublateritium (strain FD-334 SS-4) TaxID=945553 RepID=A0A0D2PFK8_HYPSF|nr:hypothetical protein HYPSUDRAFT_35195 [Hypholoma sublateritium FD-334 SS-4]
MATTASIPAYLLPGVPVHQPPHLDGDASLATEILPGPPSSASLQQHTLKRDPRKPSLAFSYLPTSDPGSTYSGLTHGTLIGQDLEGPRSKRSRVDKGTATGRAQRASARNQSSSGAATLAPEPPSHLESGLHSLSQPMAFDSDSPTMVVDKEPSLSRSNSSVNLLEPPPLLAAPAGRPKRKDKGKGKEVDSPPLRVKEEPKAISLNNSPEPQNNLLNNEDHCSSCRSYGSLVYCDGCPRAFHFWCLDPPLESVDDDGDARWFCSTCVARKHPPRKPPPSLFSTAIHQLQISNPVEFQLPEDIRSHFKDVATGPKGNYLDSSGIKPPRLNRHGQLEDRDPHRLRDRNGGPILCFQCGLSALPSSLSASVPAAKRTRRSTSKASTPDTWKSIISCDYCNLHWHMDCIDPPLLTLPPFNKKWMCPNHAERVLAPKRRIPKQHATPIEIHKPRQYNNGNIEVIHPEYSSTVPSRNMPTDEVLINGRRYRVPERVIVLDFWNKLNKWDEHINKDSDIASGMSSPLTSLSSLDDSDEPLSPIGNPNGGLDELSAAQLLWGFATSRKPEASHARGRKTHDRGVQTEYELPKPPVKNKVGRPRKYPLPEPKANGIHVVNRLSESTNASSNVTVSAVRRRRMSQQVAPEPSTRQLRSRSKNHVNDTPIISVSSRSSLKQGEENLVSSGGPNPPIDNQNKTKMVNVKMEEPDAPLLTAENSIASSSTLSKTSRAARTPRQAKQKEITVDGSIKEKRGRKRKTREDELPSADAENGFANNDHRDSIKNIREEKIDKAEKQDKETRKFKRTPARHGQIHLGTQETPPTSSSVPFQSPSLSITPSLKIRLPRLSNLNTNNSSLALSTSHLDTPTRR